MIAAFAATAGSAGAAQSDPAPAGDSSGTPVWLVPGVDLGALLGPTTQVPTELLKPVNGLLTVLNG